MLQTRLTVLLLTDIVRSTELKSARGADEYARLLERHNALFESVSRNFNGTILKHTGDGFLASFESSADAVRTALAFQQRLRADELTQGLMVRVGVHAGEVAVVEMAGRPDVVGVAADLTARLTSLAGGGQILLTRTAFNDARQFVSEQPACDGQAAAPLTWSAHGSYLFKGLDDPVEVFEVASEGAPPAVPTAGETARRVVPHDQEQTLGWRPAVGLAIPGRVGWALERRLGEGGFGEVWLARHERTKQRHVFKFCFDVERLRSFKREMTLFRLLQDALGDRHDIARLYDVKLDKPPFFLESEWTEGGDLHDWASNVGGLPNTPLNQRIQIATDVANAVAAAHSVGVLHKDIKPSNVLISVTADGQVHPRLADFGIGFLADRSQLDRRHITATGFTVMTDASTPTGSATRLYAPPELLAGKPFTIQGDVYALGVLLYQLAVADLNRPLAEGWERDVPHELLREDIAACVEGDPQRRLQSAAELVRRLQSLDQRAQARQREQLAKDAALRRKRMFRAAAVACVALILLSAIMLLGFLRERRLRNQLAESQRQAAANEKTAKQNEKLAERRLVQGLTSAGDALQASNQILRARDVYADAILAARKQAMPHDAAMSGLSYTYQLSPAPLLHLYVDRGISTTDVVFSPDGRVIAAAVPLWAVENPSASTAPSATTTPTTTQATTRNTPWNCIALFDVTTGSIKKLLRGHGRHVRSLAFTSNGKQLLSGSDDGTARLWDVDSATELRRFEVKHDDGAAVAFTRDDKYALVASNDQTVRIWNVDTGKLVRAISNGAAGQIWTFALSPDQKLLATGGHRGRLRLYNFEPGAELPVSSQFPTNRGQINCVTFTPDSKALFSSYWDHTISLYDVKTGKEIRRFEGPQANPRKIVCSRDGLRIASVYDDGVVRIWDVSTGKELRSIAAVSSTFLSVDLSPDGRLLVTSDLRLWDAKDQTDRAAFTGHERGITSCSISPDGRLAVSGDQIGLLKLWDTSTLAELRTILAHGGGVDSVAFLPDGLHVVTAGRDEAVRLWDLRDGKVAQTYPVSGLVEVGGEGLAVPSPDGRILAIKLIDGMKLVDRQTGAELRRLQGADAVIAAAFSPDGNQILTGHASNRNPAKLWDATTGRLIRALPGHRGWVARVAISPDGKHALTGSWDTTAICWDLDTAEPLHELIHSGIVYSVAFSPDGRTAITGSTDRTVRLWDLSNGNEIRSYNGHTHSVRCVGFFPSTQTAFSGSIDATVRLWRLDWAERYSRHARSFTQAQRVLSTRPSDPDAFIAMGEAYAFRGQWDWAATLFDRAAAAGGRPPPLSFAKSCLQSGRTAQARDLLRATDEPATSYPAICAAAVDSTAPRDTAQILINSLKDQPALAILETANLHAYRLRVAGEMEKALQLRTVVVEAAGRRWPADFPIVARYKLDLAELLLQANRFDQADALAHDVERIRFLPEHVARALAIHQSVARNTGRPPPIPTSTPTSLPSEPASSWTEEMISAASMEARKFQAENKLPEAATLRRLIFLAAKSLWPPESENVSRHQGAYASVLMLLKKHDQAAEQLQQIYEHTKAQGDSDAMQKVLSDLVKNYELWGKHDEAEKYSSLLQQIAPATQSTSAPATQE
jgi:WD40 repeat protein/class 3 adenylate cyclase